MIWASRFEEHKASAGGSGKGRRVQPGETRATATRSASRYALCEGEITRVGRVWADGVELAPRRHQPARLHGQRGPAAGPEDRGGRGAGEHARLSRHRLRGDRGPRPHAVRQPGPAVQLRGDAPGAAEGRVAPPALARSIEAVAMMPGTGEYALATDAGALPTTRRAGTGRPTSTRPAARPTSSTSLDALRDEVPNWGSASLIVSWFGDDLRCGACRIRPKVEQQGARRRRDALERLGRDPRDGRADRAAGRAVRSTAARRPTSRSSRPSARCRERGKRGHVLSVHPDGPAGRERPARSLDRTRSSSRRCRGAAGSPRRALPGRPARPTDSAERGRRGARLLRDGRRRGLRRLGDGGRATRARRMVAIAASSSTMRISAPRRAGSTRSASAPRCAA